MFMTYRLFCKNFYSGFGALEAGLEHIECAHRANSIDLEKLRAV